VKQEIWLGDCLELIKNIPNESVDLVVTDPPYRMRKNGKSCRQNYMPASSTENLFKGKIPDTQSWMDELFRVLKDGTHFYVFCNINELKNFLNCAEKSGFKLHNLISIIKNTKMPNRWYLKYTENLLFFRKGRAKAIKDPTSRDYMFVETPTQKSGKIHITQKPLDLIEKLINNSSNEGDLVLDIFSGSGTTGVACKNLNRQFVLMEKDEKYHKDSVERLK
jgi:site-specific DNA-methyltransferase (adenine-specific)